VRLRVIPSDSALVDAFGKGCMTVSQTMETANAIANRDGQRGSGTVVQPQRRRPGAWCDSEAPGARVPQTMTHVVDVPSVLTLTVLEAPVAVGLLVVRDLLRIGRRRAAAPPRRTPTRGPLQHVARFRTTER
jgi:hypothetical protein